jgi:hypothetical protein
LLRFCFRRLNGMICTGPVVCRFVKLTA